MRNAAVLEMAAFFFNSTKKCSSNKLYIYDL